MHNLSLITLISISLALTSPAASAQVNPESETDHASSHHGDVSPSPEAVLTSYRKAIESLDSSKMTGLFAEQSKVFENGKDEGSFANYLAHHLGPELDHVKSFVFTSPSVSVTTLGDTAIAHESYGYTIKLADGRVIERTGVATSVLRKIGNEWKIIQYHSSSRAPKKN